MAVQLTSSREGASSGGLTLAPNTWIGLQAIGQPPSQSLAIGFNPPASLSMFSFGPRIHGGRFAGGRFQSVEGSFLGIRFESGRARDTLNKFGGLLSTLKYIQGNVIGQSCETINQRLP